MREFDLVGILDGMHAVAPLPDLQMVPHDGLTAVLTSVSRPAFQLPKSRKQVLTDAAVRLRWQEACMTLGTILPARPHSPLSRDGAVAFLTANRLQLSRLMQRFGGLVQVQVTVSWHEAGVLDRFRDDKELAPLFAQGKATSSALERAIALLSERLSRDIGDRLDAVSVEVAALPVTSSILWNGSVLVSFSGLEPLSRAIEEIDAIWTEGLHIRQIGPAPAGSFVTLLLERVSARQVEAALGAFGLQSASEVARFDLARRERLFSAAGNTQMREEIRAQSQIVEAAARVPGAKGGFSLAKVWAEGQSSDQLHRQQVA